MSKNYVNTTTQRHVAKTETQQKQGHHTRTLQSATLCSSSASVSLEQSIKNYSPFSKETENKRRFTSDNVKILHYNCAKNSENWLKTTTIEYIQKLSSSHRKNSCNENFRKKTILSKFVWKIRSRRKSKVIMIAMHINQPSLHSKNPQKQLTTSKTFETKICKGGDGVRKFTVKSMTKPL